MSSKGRADLMSNRRLSEKELVKLRKAARDGYVTYRYGSAAPVSLPRVFVGEKRRSMVAKAMDVLRDWRMSPFELEGPARAGIRAGLCLDGHEWRRADNEAAALIEEGLHLLGAKRPTWAQGQPEYTIGRENCANCRGPLDDETLARRDRFCCQECRTVMRSYRNDRYHYAAAEAAKWAYEATRREGIPERECAWCGANFKPATMGAMGCSPECRANLRERKNGRAIPDRECLACGSTFHPAKRGVKFCSLPCHNFYQMKTLPARSCEHCGTQFQPTKSFMKYCSRACGVAAFKASVVEADPSRACEACGNLFAPKKAAQRFCGRLCARRGRESEAAAVTTFACEECPPYLEAAE
jgi:uncharacterized OB-fold protein